MEKRESMSLPPIYTIDLSNAWDTESQANIFIERLKELKIYKPNLRFSGFDGDKIGIEFSSVRNKGIVFCSTESDLYSGGGGEEENSLEYAFHYNNPAIAVYDGEQLEKKEDYAPYGYTIQDPTALIAIIRLQ